MRLSTTILCVGLTIGAAQGAAAESSHVALGVLKPSGKLIAGAGNGQRNAVNAAHAACQAKTGKKCDYTFWTLSSAFSVVKHCEIGGNKFKGYLGKASRKSVAAADAEFGQEVDRALSGSGYSAKDVKCRKVGALSQGKLVAY